MTSLQDSFNYEMNFSNRKIMDKHLVCGILIGVELNVNYS